MTGPDDSATVDGADDAADPDTGSTPGSAGEPAADAQPIISGRSVVKAYVTGGETVRALRGIDFRVDPGEFVAIVGPSGSGKSTLLNMLGLLDVPTGGVVELEGVDVETFSDAERTRRRKETIGFVFQSFHLIPTLTAVENVEVPRLLDRTPARTREAATDLLERVGLGDRLGHYPDELSGGQKQRVAIARALVNDPGLLLADEPTGNLDRETGDQILAEFDAITDEGVAVVTVTHDDYVAQFADRVVNLIDGTVRDDEEAVTG
ncbi:ABC transporter ATP-binding protein [Halobaculum gomorrense]|uniref:Putative ABC transport system ATP-binding protein n=1 Tax=Halobaculum gomorrense TaxID=43928 RepID=A0A1M5SVE9_9EURY|nr:ABC transporter ATP-binding protein [Halobaculum gomorrense]SHH42238.1 putative ABC transport system ATP-binding protein [Halobaculum gomorrense]